MFNETFYAYNKKGLAKCSGIRLKISDKCPHKHNNSLLKKVQFCDLMRVFFSLLIFFKLHKLCHSSELSSDQSKSIDVKLQPLRQSYVFG